MSREKELLRQQLELLAEQSKSAEKKTTHRGGGAGDKKGFAIVAILFGVLSVVCFLTCLLCEMSISQRLSHLVALICSAHQFGWYLRAWLD